MNTLIKALEARGFTISVTPKNGYDRVASYFTCVSVLGETIKFGLREFIKQTRRELTPEEEKRKNENPWYEPYPKFVHNPSGRLTLEIKTWGYSRKNWSDGKRQRVEGRLNEFIIGLINIAVKERAWKIKREIEEQERQERERRREEIARLRRDEETRVQALMQNAADWHRSRQVREYIEAVRKEALRKHGEIVPGSEIDRWLKWAKQLADRLDPFVENPPSILD